MILKVLSDRDGEQAVTSIQCARVDAVRLSDGTIRIETKMPANTITLPDDGHSAYVVTDGGNTVDRHRVNQPNGGRR